MTDIPEGPPCIAYHSHERYQEFHGDDVDDDDKPTKKLPTHLTTTFDDEKEEFYDPEVDSPSSWTTTQSSQEERRCWDRCVQWRNTKTAKLTRIFSNVLLALATVAGIVCGAFLRFVDHSNSYKEVGVAIMFGSAVGGAIALILVNVSWSYRRKNDEITLQPDWCYTSLYFACPMAQFSGSLVIFLTGAILVPAYHYNTRAVLILIFGILSPLLLLVNIPMLFDGISEDNRGTTAEQQTGQKELEVLPGCTLDCHKEPKSNRTKVRKHKELPFSRLR